MDVEWLSFNNFYAKGIYCLAYWPTGEEKK
jgi:hypothetical protein